MTNKIMKIQFLLLQRGHIKNYIDNGKIIHKFGILLLNFYYVQKCPQIDVKRFICSLK